MPIFFLCLAISTGRHRNQKLVPEWYSPSIQFETGIGERTCLSWNTALHEKNFLCDKMTFWKSQLWQQYHPNPLHILSEQRVNPVIICRIHLHMISVDALLASYYLGEFSSDCIKINKNLDINVLLNIIIIIIIIMDWLHR